VRWLERRIICAQSACHCIRRVSSPPMTAPLCLLFALLAISWSAILIRLCEAPALVGTAFVVIGDWGAGGGLLGDLLAVLGAVTVSVYFLIGRSQRHRVALGSYLLFSEAPTWSWYAGTVGVGAGVAWTAREEWQRQSKLTDSI